MAYPFVLSVPFVAFVVNAFSLSSAMISGCIRRPARIGAHRNG
jgi:hypothetical protein